MSRSKLGALALRLLPGLLAVTVLVGTPAAASASARHVTSHRHVRHPRARVVHHSTIPQHNAGDGDPDNNGAASDGDGNL